MIPLIFRIFGVPPEQLQKEIMINPEDSIDKIKLIVCRTFKLIYSQDYLLVRKQDILDDKKRIADYRIQSNEIINLIEKENYNDYINKVR